jgi:Gpi18-like mannosyltransferase
VIVQAALAPLPRWVRVADIAALALLILGAMVFAFGGFREQMLFGRVSITSGVRPLIVAAIVLLLRHWAWRQPTVLARASDAWTAMRASAAWRAAWPAFVSTRLAVLLVGFFGIAIIGYAPNTPPWRIYDNDFLNLPARWDTGWYIGIAERGYRWEPQNASAMQNIAFFPAFPTITYYVSLLMGRQTVWAGVLVSLISFLFALHYLFRFARDKVGDDGAAAAVMWIAAYPFALFFSTAYTEGLFLLTAIAACYHFERDELLAAASWGLIAGLSRPNGCLLSIVLALVAVRDFRSTPLAMVARRIAVAATPGIGMVIYSAYIYQLTGNPLQWANNHAAYGRVYRGIGALISDRLDYISINGFYNYVTVLALDVMNLVPILFAVAAIVPVYRLLGTPYAVMIAVNVLLPVLMGGVLSMGRVTSVLFPLFIWLGVAVPRQLRTPWLIGFAMLQALFAIAFFTWRPLV